MARPAGRSKRHEPYDMTSTSIFEVGVGSGKESPVVSRPIGWSSKVQIADGSWDVGPMQEVSSKDTRMHRHEKLMLLEAEGPGVQLILLQKTHGARSRKARGTADIVTKDSRC